MSLRKTRGHEGTAIQRGHWILWLQLRINFTFGPMPLHGSKGWWVRERERDLMMDFHSLWSDHSQFIPYSLPWNFLDTRNLTVLCLSGFTFVKKGNFWKNLRRRALVTRQRFLFNYTTSFRFLFLIIFCCKCNTLLFSSTAFFDFLLQL